MDIVITLEDRDPPAGRVVAVGSDRGTQDYCGEPVSFTGWLGLLAVLSSLVEPPDGPDDGGG